MYVYTQTHEHWGVTLIYTRVVQMGACNCLGRISSWHASQSYTIWGCLCGCTFFDLTAPVKGSNLAKGNKAYQMFNVNSRKYLASNAVDGKKSTSPTSCTHTGSHDQAWWSVDLEKRYKVNDVVVTTRNTASKYNLCHSDGLLQEKRNSIANALVLRLSCNNPSTCPCQWQLITQNLLMGLFWI